jgi:hypothetical protein
VVSFVGLVEIHVWCERCAYSTMQQMYVLCNMPVYTYVAGNVDGIEHHHFGLVGALLTLKVCQLDRRSFEVWQITDPGAEPSDTQY